MRAYSVDLREKTVDALLRRRMSREEVVRTFGVGVSWVRRYVKKAEKGESLAPVKARGRERNLRESGMKLLEEDLHARLALTCRRGEDKSPTHRRCPGVLPRGLGQSPSRRSWCRWRGVLLLGCTACPSYKPEP